MKIIGIVFLYFPNEFEILRNIDRYESALCKLLVYNNTPGVENKRYMQLFRGCSYFDKLEFIGGEGNKGLAYPINIAMKRTITEGYDMLLTMDQDSLWENFAEFVNAVEKQNDFQSKIFRPNFHKDNCADDEFSITNDVLFNSGTLYGKDALKQIGLMNEVMFVEGIDIEYGIRAKLAGVPILTYRNGKMLHNREEVNNYHKHIFGRNIPRCKYNAQRLYGITFSNVLMAREFSGDIRKQVIKGIFVSYGFKTTILPIMLFENNKCNRLYLYFKGIIDAMFVKVTKYN